MAKLFNVRMEPELHEAIESQAKADEVKSKSVWAREALAGVVRLGGLTKLQTAIEDTEGRGSHSTASDSASLSPHPARSLALQAKPREARSSTECQHPRTARRRLPFLEVCGVCGVTVRVTG